MNHLRTYLLLALVGAGCAWFGAPAAMAGEYPAAGSTGYGETVFSGHTIERFDVEILGVLKRTGSTGDMILARLSGGPLAKTGVMQGMSGSPVWVDGQLIGAVAGTWAFVTEPIAAIRPIGEMRRLASSLQAGEHPTWQPGESRAMTPTGFADGASSIDLSQFLTSPSLENDASAREPLSGLDVGGPGGLAWTASGFAPEVHRELERALGSMLSPASIPVSAQASTSSPEGDATTAASPTLNAGDAIAVFLVDGDARLAAVGTVTERIDDTILAFGHPFLGTGPLSLPMARAEVIALMPSQQLSSKIAAPTVEVGALLLDRSSGISGQLGVTADMMPVDVNLVNADASTESYEFRVARTPQLSAALAYWTVQSALLVTYDLASPATADLTVTLHLDGEGIVVSHAAVTGLNIGGQLASELTLPLNLLNFNPDQALRVDSMDVRLDMRPGIHGATLGRAVMHPAAPERGETVTLRVELLPYRDEAHWIEIPVEIPAGLADGRYVLHVSDGTQAFQEEIIRATARWRRAGLRQIREAFSLREPATNLVAVLYGAPQAVIVRGVEMDRLPGSARDVLTRSHGAPPAERVQATPLVRQSVRTDWVLTGTATIPWQLGPPPPPAPPTSPTTIVRP